MKRALRSAIDAIRRSFALVFGMIVALVVARTYSYMRVSGDQQSVAFAPDANPVIDVYRLPAPCIHLGSSDEEAWALIQEYKLATFSP